MGHDRALQRLEGVVNGERRMEVIGIGRIDHRAIGMGSDVCSHTN
jgi:hypothetical protein